MNCHLRRCLGCGGDLEPRRKDQVYHNGTCRWRAWAVRQAILLRLLPMGTIKGVS